MPIPELYVWRGHELVGWFRGGHKSMTFSYAGGVSVPISLSLPIGSKPRRQAALNYLENLLPEGFGARSAMAEATGANPTSVFDLLASVDSAGGLVFTKTPDEPDLAWVPPTVMTNADIESQVARISAGAAAYSSVDGHARFSIAGQQGKFTASRIDDRWFWPSATLPSTHIFKPDPSRVESVAKVEHICMELAGVMGRDVPASSCVPVGNTDVYVVSRFDREATAEGSVNRIHVEDLCQSLGIAPQRKYEPNATDVVRVLRDGGMPESDLLAWFLQMACSTLLGNCDAHAKNYSIFLDGGAPRLCPMYDVVSTMVWPRYDARLAMPVNGKDDASEVGLADWRAEATACGLDPDEIEVDVRSMAQELRDALPSAEASLGNDLGSRFHDVIAHTTVTLERDLGFSIV